MYKRILLKISGEALAGEGAHGIDPTTVQLLISELTAVAAQELVIVVGGGNIFRGLEGTAHGLDQATSDYMGMLGTVINALALQAVLQENKVEARAMSAIPMERVCESYSVTKALHHIKKKRIVICGGGTGNPFFTTDTTAALRALELRCDVILKASKVDGVYDSDPKKNPAAKKYETLTYTKALADNLRVMDATALSLCREHTIPIIVFNLFDRGNLARAISGATIGTRITE